MDKENAVGIIPCFNAENNIARVVGESLAFLETVIVIDDGSTDTSAELAKSAGAQVYCHRKNLGVGAALMTGFRASEQMNAKSIIILDADGAHNPSNIPALLQVHKKKYVYFNDWFQIFFT
jgi:glycosyltransferase involved in cell wall biosynthesis